MLAFNFPWPVKSLAREVIAYYFTGPWPVKFGIATSQAEAREVLALLLHRALARGIFSIFQRAGYFTGQLSTVQISAFRAKVVY